tara:strand:- start:151 stop:390 length:240 start_codon:yes stop_codon:yes gene_type:complete
MIDWRRFVTGFFERTPMETALPIITALAALGGIMATATWINRRYNFTVTPPPPPPSTPEEIQWERERATLRLCLRHPYC